MPLHPDITVYPDATLYPDQASLTNKQWALPASDVSSGGWTATPLYAKIDESVANDADFITSSTSPGTPDIAEVTLSPVLNPLNPDGQVVRYRFKKNAAGGDSLRLTVTLLQGLTTIASWQHNDVTDGTWTDGMQVLSAAQVASITDYSNLRLRFEALVL